MELFTFSPLVEAESSSAACECERDDWTTELRCTTEFARWSIISSLRDGAGELSKALIMERFCEAKLLGVSKLRFTSQRSFLSAITNLVKASVTFALSLSSSQLAKVCPVLPQIPQGVEEVSNVNSRSRKLLFLIPFATALMTSVKCRTSSFRSPNYVPIFKPCTTYS